VTIVESTTALAKAVFSPSFEVYPTQGAVLQELQSHPYSVLGAPLIEGRDAFEVGGASLNGDGPTQTIACGPVQPERRSAAILRPICWPGCVERQLRGRLECHAERQNPPQSCASTASCAGCTSPVQATTPSSSPIDPMASCAECS